MKFRPCIDIHNGQVKQLVGGSLADKEGGSAKENFVSQRGADYYAARYREDGLRGGHIILLNPAGTEEYAADLEQARRALAQWPGGLQIGGGVRAETAAAFLDMGASHVIVTSYVFAGGEIRYGNLERLVREVGKERIVLDVSCRRKPAGAIPMESCGGSEGGSLMEDLEDAYLVVTDRWQSYTNVPVNGQTLRGLAGYCDEFLIHAVDVEGLCSGIEEELAELLGKNAACPMTYAGGVAGLADIRRLFRLGQGKLDVTVGSALDLFGGRLPYREVLAEIRRLEEAGE